MRIGHGYDVHRLGKNRRLIIGGVEIPFPLGLEGHSDADVLLHAVMDALLGAAALGDIGRHFPDTEGAYKDADSMVLLEKVSALLDEKGLIIENIDGTILAQNGPLYRKHAGKYCPGFGDRAFPSKYQGHHRGGNGIYRKGRGDCRSLRLSFKQCGGCLFPGRNVGRLRRLPGLSAKLR